MSGKRKLVLYIAMSLDGYIATEDESLDWLFNVEGEGDNGYLEFYETVDTILMGNKTYEWIKKHETREFPYKNKDCYVFTRSSLEDTEDVKFINDNVGSVINELRNQEGRNIWIVGGGELLQFLLKAKLVDVIILIVAPAIIGKGIPLFKKGDYQLDLTLQGTRNFNQFVELRYSVKK
ncbi:dihydrofolate reductase family protein [Sporosarcina sp. SAFN-015]|uniref:dihydrofolate reductase family protein n=1 Tax=Sporosarcina sp. SAFN-015 TaxID=3387274 RepID=UPI003F7E8918